MNTGHYSVGQVHATGAVQTEAAEWSPSGQFELLNDLIPAGLGWDLQNAVAISDNASISQIAVVGDRWIVRRFNDTAHLTPHFSLVGAPPL